MVVESVRISPPPRELARNSMLKVSEHETSHIVMFENACRDRATGPIQAGSVKIYDKTPTPSSLRVIKFSVF